MSIVYAAWLLVVSLTPIIVVGGFFAVGSLVHLHWLAFGPRRSMPPIPEPESYPRRGAGMAFQVGLATLAAQDSASSLLDNKISQISTAAGVLMALLTAVWGAGASTNVQFGEWERGLGVAALAVFVLALLDGVLGMRLDTFETAPDLGEVRQVFGGPSRTTDVEWVIVFTIERTIASNTWLSERKQAAYQAVWFLVLAGIVLVMLAALARMLGL